MELLIRCDDMDGVYTTIAEGTNGQLLVTVPKQVAMIEGIRKGSKIRWFRDEKNGILMGEVIK